MLALTPADGACEVGYNTDMQPPSFGYFHVTFWGPCQQEGSRPCHCTYSVGDVLFFKCLH